ncbi:biotin/lipoyl-binding protein [Candidatus Dactylopiibacterium carminicum]|uniref:biotin/lipoyl-binding protein n=1 Tax=Candidatus Dactylopiibacterium carminicum TaxID=857335 RepID=UPI0014831FA9|nr:biotin/lipoyl-binding protein [Candidatus Dactylopiibacterium carminicum]
MRRPEILPVLACLLLAGCGPRDDAGLPGYIEADYTRVAAPLAGRLVALQVRKGEEVAQDAPLFVLDQAQEDAVVAEADARLRRQDATAADLAKGKRREEIAVLQAQERQAAAQLALSEADLRRQRQLAAQGFISGAGLDSLQTRVQADSGKLAEVRASLQVARLASRRDAQDAAQADIAAARAALRADAMAARSEGGARASGRTRG